MIIDFFIGPFVELFVWLTSFLPEHDLGLPEMGAMVTWLARIDSVIPIGPVVSIAITMLGMGAVFVFIRLILLVRHIALPQGDSVYIVAVLLLVVFVGLLFLRRAVGAPPRSHPTGGDS